MLVENSSVRNNDVVIDMGARVIAVSPSDRKGKLGDMVTGASNRIGASANSVLLLGGCSDSKKLGRNLKEISRVVRMGVSVDNKIKNKYFDDNVFFGNLERSYDRLAISVQRLTELVERSGPLSGNVMDEVMNAMSRIVGELDELHLRHSDLDQFDNKAEVFAEYLKYFGAVIGSLSTGVSGFLGFWQFVDNTISGTSEPPAAILQGMRRTVFDVIQNMVVALDTVSLFAFAYCRYKSANDKREISQFLGCLKALSGSFKEHIMRMKRLIPFQEKSWADSEFEKLESKLCLFYREMQVPEFVGKIKELNDRIIGRFEDIRRVVDEKNLRVRGLDRVSCEKYQAVMKSATGVLDRVNPEYLALGANRDQLARITTGCLAAVELLYDIAVDHNGPWPAMEVVQAVQIFAAKLIEGGEALDALLRHEKPSVARTVVREAKENAIFVLPTITAAIGLNVDANTVLFAKWTSYVVKTVNFVLTGTTVAVFVRDWKLGRLHQHAKDVRFAISQAANALEEALPPWGEINEFDRASELMREALANSARAADQLRRAEDALGHDEDLHGIDSAALRRPMMSGAIHEVSASQASDDGESQETTIHRLFAVSRNRTDPLRMAEEGRSPPVTTVDLSPSSPSFATGSLHEQDGMSRRPQSVSPVVIPRRSPAASLSNPSRSVDNISVFSTSSDSIPINALPSSQGLRRRASLLTTVIKPLRDI